MIVAFFYHAVTFELFDGEKRLIGIVASTILFVVNYNIPLISNYWNVWDIIFFGIIFSYSYSVHRNPLALFIAYLLNEVPMWWCVLAPFGESVFLLYFVIRIGISLFALFLFLVGKSGIKTS